MIARLTFFKFKRYIIPPTIYATGYDCISDMDKNNKNLYHKKYLRNNKMMKNYMNINHVRQEI